LLVLTVTNMANNKAVCSLLKPPNVL
jgi:hypothetical protein